MKLKNELKPLMKYLKEDKIRIIFVIISVLITSILGLSYGYLVGKIVEEITNYHLKLAIIFASIYLFMELVIDLQLRKRSQLALQKIKLDLTRKLSLEVYHKTLKLPARAFEEKTSGEIINRVTSDTETVTDLFDELINLVIDVLSCIIILIFVFYNSWIIGLEILVFIILMTVFTTIYSPKLREMHKKISKINDECTSSINQSVAGIREIKTLGISKRVNKLMNNKINDMFDNRKQFETYRNKYWTTIRCLSCIYEVVIILTCGLLVYYGKAGIGFFIAMTYYLYRYMNIALEFSDIIPNYQKVFVSIKRINELIQNKLYKDEVYGEYSKKKFIGNITFKDVTFGYEKENIVLNNFNMYIPTNKKVAIVGPSGQGKTTIFNLLTRVFDPNEGNIYIDNVDLLDISEDNLRSTISIIRQDPFLFNKTIKENFLIVNPKLTNKEMIEYCKQAKIHDYIMTLPNKYDTVLGEGGVNLSGGQKQRIAIARALIKQSKIILFDEATSALDNNSQDHIKKTIDSLAKDHTVVIVAHRLTTIDDADIINVINEGRVVATGTKDELLKNCEIFKQLYNSETKGSLSSSVGGTKN